ncbi:hypothetical protein TRFO_41413 [Tritrichomonas foetus]|uniref:DNA-directed DNA polymerase n=1 Tax=Tritrichomonas foetus TaxID=1144522 RepID=A0A1J4L0E7_9EUKA|nr:hypothetical protein TRFO_41413 [Tritrichomonas foetus]|eukprot:OHT16975.1 hypothetical protein TRFO_41413 [Tritrichomonas foetus]
MIQALITSGLFNDAAIELARSICNTQSIPIENLHQFAEALDLSFKIGKKFIGNNPVAIPLFIMHQHYMLDITLPIHPCYIRHWREIEAYTKINEERKFTVCSYTANSYKYDDSVQTPLKKLLKVMFEEKCFTPLTEEQKELAAPFDPPIDLDQLDFSVLSLTPCTLMKAPQFKADKILLASDAQFAHLPKYCSFIRQGNIVYRRASTLLFDLTLEEFKSLSIYLAQITHYPIMAFNTVAQYAECLLCDNAAGIMYKLSGVIQRFIKRCVHGGLIDIWRRGIYESDYYLIDQNSSYGSSMAEIGMPYGEPDLIQIDSRLDDLPFASFLKIEVYSIEEDRDCIVKPFIEKPGIYYLTKPRLESTLMTHHIVYRILGGYSFAEMKHEPIKSFLEDLYQIRLMNPAYSKHIKFIINCMFGNSIRKTKNTYIKGYEKDMEFKYHEYLLSENKGTYQLLSPIVYDPTMPQFGSLVIDANILKMTKLALKTHPLYMNVDSFIVQKEKLDYFKFGDRLGEWHSSTNYTKAIFVSPRNWLLRNNEGQFEFRMTASIRRKYGVQEDKLELIENALTNALRFDQF